MMDYQAKYESLLRNVLSDLNTEVLAAQSRAEKNAEASSAYCTELKERLRESESELEAVKNELAVLQEKAGNEIAVLREELACTQSQLAESQEKLKVYAEREKLAKTESEQPIAADSTYMSGDGHVTSSIVLEFLSGLSGLSVCQCAKGSGSTVFHCEVSDGSLAGHTFTLTLDSKSGEFTYQPLQVNPSLPPGSMLAGITCFPNYMQSRFLLNLLNATFLHPAS